MIDYWLLLLLGAIAGCTIFIGRPVAKLQHLSSKKKGFLNAHALGILVFLIIDVFSHAYTTASNAATDAFSGKVNTGNAGVELAAMFGGIAIGLMGLVYYATKVMTKKFPQIF